ncbi:hypothetical protein BgiBS90_031204, partial [Biomphalaria glabrata]
RVVSETHGIKCNYKSMSHNHRLISIRRVKQQNKVNRTELDYTGVVELEEELFSNNVNRNMGRLLYIELIY